MGVTGWTWVFVALTFSLYIYIAWRSRVRDTRGFYVAGQGVPAVANGAAVAADGRVTGQAWWRRSLRTSDYF
jgi:cation/acetate symporter